MKSFQARGTVALLAAFFCLAGCRSSGAVPTVQPGDLNGDGQVTTADAVLDLRIAVGLSPASAELLSRGDLFPIGRPDGKITVTDALTVLREAVGLLSPCELLPQQDLRFQVWAAGWSPGLWKESLKAAQAQASALETISAFEYDFDPSLQLTGGAGLSPTPDETARALRDAVSSAPVPVLATVVNDVVDGGLATRLKDPRSTHELLATSAARARLIQQILQVSAPLDGVEIDFENMLSTDRQSFTLFVQGLAQQLHLQQKALWVVAQAKTNDAVKDGPGAIDWQAVGAAADRVTVLLYYRHSSRSAPGPIAPLDWVCQVAGFAVMQVPRGKLSMAMSLAGLDWPQSGLGAAVLPDEIAVLEARPGVSVERDGDCSPHFQYTDSQGTVHDVWYEDAVSVRRKAETLSSLGITHLALWRFEAAVAAFWSGGA